jgi:ribonuclease HI
LIKALEWALEHGYEGEEIHLKGDSQLAVRQLNGEYRVRSPNIRPLSQRARSILEKFSWRISWIPREQNREADTLSQKAYREFWRKWKGGDPPKPRWRR